MIAAGPRQMKLVNEGLIHRALLARGQASTAELVADTGLSQTTVNQVLAQMLAEGLVSDSLKRGSSGGRRAAAWALRPEAGACLAIAIEVRSLSWRLCDALGATVEEGSQGYAEARLDEALELARQLRARAVGEGERPCVLALGLPGTLKDGRIISGDLIETWAGIDLAAVFSKAASLPALVESDVNAIALGCSRSEGPARPRSLAYIHFSEGACMGSGLVVGERIHRGARGYAGELGCLPLGREGSLDELIAGGAEDGAYIEALVAALRIVNCVVNPERIVMGGAGFRFSLGGEIARRFEDLVEEELRPGLAFVEDCLPFYLSGLEALAAERLSPSYRLLDGPWSD